MDIRIRVILKVQFKIKTKVKDVVGPLKDGEDQLVSDNEVMCEILNSYFGSVLRPRMLIMICRK